MSDFEVGQRIVCVVGADYWASRTWRGWIKVLIWRPRIPLKGRIYDVEATVLVNGGQPRLFLRLRGFGPVRYYHEGFRPVHEREADLSQFEAVLDGVRRGAPALAN